MSFAFDQILWILGQHCSTQLEVGVTYIYLSLACVVAQQLHYLCTTPLIWSLFSGFVMKSYYSTWEMADSHFIFGCANGNSQEAHHLYTKHYPQCRIPSHRLFTSDWKIWVLCSMGIRLWRALISENSQHGSSHIKKSGRRSWFQCAKNCNCWRYQCYACLENWRRIPKQVSARPHSAWPSCKGVFCQWLLKNVL